MSVEYLPYYIINLIELIAAIIALISYKKYAASTERYFLHFLWFTFIIDFTAGLLGDYFKIPNTWIYNVYMGVSFLFYFKWYHTVLVQSLYKKTAVVFTIILLTIFTTDLITYPSNEYYSNTFITGAVFVLILTGFYLYQLIYTKHSIAIKHKLSFWIAVALVLFNIGMIPFILLSKYFNLWGNNFVYITILLFLNIILYGCYIVGFLWTKKKYNHF